MNDYEKIMIEQCEKAINFKGSVGITIAPVYAERITIDGINYFNRVKGIRIIYHDIEIASYDLDTKKLTYLTRHSNIAVLQEVIYLLNNFVGYKKYHLNNKKEKAFNQFIEQVDGGLSNYELGEMFMYMKEGV